MGCAPPASPTAPARPRALSAATCPSHFHGERVQGPRPLSLGRPRPGGGGGQSSPPGARAASGVGLTGLLTTRCKEPTWEAGRGHGSGTWLHVGSVRGDARALPSMGPADHPRAEVSSFPSDGALGSGAVSPSGTWHRASGCRACSPVRKDRPSAFSAGPRGSERLRGCAGRGRHTSILRISRRRRLRSALPGAQRPCGASDRPGTGCFGHGPRSHGPRCPGPSEGLSIPRMESARWLSRFFLHKTLSDGCFAHCITHRGAPWRELTVGFI